MAVITFAEEEDCVIALGDDERCLRVTAVIADPLGQEALGGSRE